MGALTNQISAPKHNNRSKRSCGILNKNASLLLPPVLSNYLVRKPIVLLLKSSPFCRKSSKNARAFFCSLCWSVSIFCTEFTRSEHFCDNPVDRVVSNIWIIVNKSTYRQMTILSPYSIHLFNDLVGPNTGAATQLFIVQIFETIFKVSTPLLNFWCPDSCMLIHKVQLPMSYSSSRTF